jgi:hypothetical protein
VLPVVRKSDAFNAAVTVCVPAFADAYVPEVICGMLAPSPGTKPVMLKLSVNRAAVVVPLYGLLGLPMSATVSGAGVMFAVRPVGSVST